MKKKTAVIIGIAGAAAIIAGGWYISAHKAASWTITQYGSANENQMMCYTITNSKGELVIVDGGWDTDAEALMDVIKKHGNRVNAWVITHPHPDHVGAFNAIMGAEDNAVEVDQIYTVPVNRERYQETAHSYDVIDAYELFYTLTKDADHISYLNENDTFDLLGLNCSVIHSWDEHVDALPDHLCNDGSLMFKVSGNKESMLFCADVQSEMEEFIIPEHAEELKSDFVQCGHHGNWGLTTDFYDLVDAKTAFMDAPASIIDEENQKFDGYLLRNYFLEKGVKLLRPETAPNSIRLH